MLEDLKQRNAIGSARKRKKLMEFRNLEWPVSRDVKIVYYFRVSVETEFGVSLWRYESEPGLVVVNSDGKTWKDVFQAEGNDDGVGFEGNVGESVQPMDVDKFVEEK